MRYVSLVLIAALILPVAAFAANDMPAWSDEVRTLFATVPVQDDGRVKPLDTYAQFTLLKLNGKRSFYFDDGEKIDHLDWFLTCLFHREKVQDWKHFVVDNVAAIEAIGIPAHDGKRDRYSYNELQEGRPKLFQLAGEYAEIEVNERAPIESMIMNLASNVFLFETVTHYFDFAFRRFTVTGESQVAQAFPEAGGVSLSTVLERLPKVFAGLQQDTTLQSDPEALNVEVAAMSGLLEQLEAATRTAQALALFPPVDPDDKVWRSPADLMAMAINPRAAGSERVDLLAEVERLPVLRDDPQAFLGALGEFHRDVVAAAKARGEYSKVPLEVHYYNAQYLWYALYLYVFSFILVALSWLAPNARFLHRVVTPIAVMVPTALLIAGITLRCIIRSRPPVSTLYETVLFITAVAVVIALLIEFMNKQRIAIAVAAFLGVAGMFLSFRYEAKEGVDTMPSLVAVLDTNFWLATHVTIINVGYAAGMLSGAIAHIYIFGKLVGFKKRDKNFYRTVTRMVYGVLCFGLLFSVVGTILGGIWANDSWGRFWGWDPKENGALLICIWSLIVLHAKMGRYILDLGVNAGAVILAMWVAFSWWGVNNLGVGLHAYGFTDGLWMKLTMFWAFEAFMVLLAGFIWFREELRKPNPPKAAKA